jgi:hypothetical protein
MVSLLLIGTLTTSNLFAVAEGDYCVGGKCYSPLIERIKRLKELKKRQKIEDSTILKVDESYELDISMGIEQQKADGKSSVIVNTGFDADGDYTETFIYINILNDSKEEDVTPKFFCPDKKTLYCEKITPTSSNCKCV